MGRTIFVLYKAPASPKTPACLRIAGIPAKNRASRPLNSVGGYENPGFRTAYSKHLCVMLSRLRNFLISDEWEYPGLLSNFPLTSCVCRGGASPILTATPV
jgi:hypothetical protein